MSTTILQQNVRAILKDFESAAEQYRDHKLDLNDLSQLQIPDRLSEYVANALESETKTSVTGKLGAEQLSEENTQILHRALRAMVARLSEPNIDPAHEMHVMVDDIINTLCFFIPDQEVNRLDVFIGFCHEKYQIDDNKDPADKARELEDLSRRVREAASEYLQSCEAELKA